MRHKKARLQLNRFTSWHKATLISMVKSLFIYQSIKTTLQKAKAARPLAEKLISLAKTNSLARKRRAYKILSDHKLVNLLFNELAPRFSNKLGGYTRILHLGVRRGDNANLAILELTEIKQKAKKPKKEKQKEEKPVVKDDAKAETAVEKTAAEKEVKKETKIETIVKEKPRDSKKPQKKFFWGLKNVFKKERDSL